MALRFSQILSPCGTAQFLTDYLGQRPCFLPVAFDSDRDRFRELDEPTALDALRAGMEQVLRCDVTVIAAETGGPSRLILQVDGSSRAVLTPESEPTPDKALDFALSAGDALYCPTRWNVALEPDATSRQLHLGIPQPTGGDLLAWALGLIRKVEPFHEELARFAGPATQHAQIRKLRRALTAALRSPEILREYERHLDSQTAGVCVEGLAFDTGTPGESRIAVSARRPLTVQRADKERLFVGSWEQPFFFPERSAALVHFLMERAPVAVGEFLSAFSSEFSRDELCTFLQTATRQGPFTILPPAAGPPNPPQTSSPVLTEMPSARGWLPITIGFDYRAPMISEAPVRWMELNQTRLDEPFVNDTVERLRAENPPRRELETTLEALERIGSALPPITPRGFIFHVSHCGSTLISNAMKIAGEVVVASELKSLSMLVRPFQEGLGPYLSERWDQRRQRLIAAIFNLLATYRTGEPEPLVVKFPSLGIRSMNLLRRYWPDVPCVIVIRDPMEVMVSNRPGGGWMQLKSSPTTAMDVFGWQDLPRPVDTMPDEEYAARVLASYFQAAEENLHGKVMLVDYTQLNRERMGKIGEFFGIEVDPASERMDAVMGSYAKDPEQKRPFREDRVKKQWMASVLLRSAAEVWAAPAYRRLLTKARRG